MARALDNGGDLLETLAEGLERGADSFTPEDASGAPENLPGRRRGANLAPTPPPVTGAAAVIVDCGTSRVDGYTHVLWISPSVESLLGSYAADQLADLLGGMDGVTGYQWEGLDRLHLRAPGRDWDGLLADARVVVARLLG